ncbi:MAG: hypothetical protein DRJ56_08635, partial [Thermoprotei archaeon]
MLLKELETDVLVVGAGGAGLRAALEAARRGAKVLVLSKSAPGQPVTTSLIGGWATHRRPEEARSLFEDVLDEGNYVNDQDLAWAFATDVPWRVPELADLGVEMRLEVREEERVGVVRPIWRIVGPRGRLGEGLRAPLRRAAESAGAAFAEGVMVTRLLTSEGRVVGAVAIDPAGQRALAVRSKAVVLATGGASGLFLRSDNPEGTTGDGHALALRAGAELVDMEFQIFCVSPKQLCQIFSDNLDEESVLSSAVAHYTCGGVKIDPWGRTRVPGLYAAGEVAGGVFGSARLGGSAVADIVVFGCRAGLSAADEAKSAERVADASDQVAEEVRELERLLRARGRSPQDLKAELRSLMWRAVGPIRDEERLREAAKRVRELREAAAELSAPSLAELREAVEAKLMLDVAEAMTISALERRESRGSHWRIDYPRPRR